MKLAGWASFLFLFALWGPMAAGAQTDSFPRYPSGQELQRQEDEKVVKEMLSKQQSEREKKEHIQLLKRAETAQELSDELLKAGNNDGRLSSEEEKILGELEKVVRKIRDDLGGDDDGEAAEQLAEFRNEGQAGVVKALRKSMAQLVSEVKKTTRFSISAAAIQSSNSVLRLVKFLRLRD